MEVKQDNLSPGNYKISWEAGQCNISLIPVPSRDTIRGLTSLLGRSLTVRKIKSPQRKAVTNWNGYLQSEKKKKKLLLPRGANPKRTWLRKLVPLFQILHTPSRSFSWQRHKMLYALSTHFATTLKGILMHHIFSKSSFHIKNPHSWVNQSIDSDRFDMSSAVGKPQQWKNFNSCFLLASQSLMCIPHDEHRTQWRVQWDNGVATVSAA